MKRLIVVSNRLPVVINEDAQGRSITPSSGGLVTALDPVMQANNGLWIGWPGCSDDSALPELLDQFSRQQGYGLAGVPLSEEDIEKYYLGFSNETVWPLFHDLLGHAHFDPGNWARYVEVNRRFAETVQQASSDQDLIWVHDYQLMLVGASLRELGMDQTLGYFHHIPFPSLDMFRRLPWKHDIIRALMAYDTLGFQTRRDRRNFVACVTALLPDAEIFRRYRDHILIRYGDRLVKAGHFPISIDFAEFNSAAQTQEVSEAAWYLHENLKEVQLVLGIDRLDYTKGIPERFRAFERALEKYPQLRQKLSLLQVVVPSRILVPEYQTLKQELDQLAGEINARFYQPGWTPINYVFRSLDRTQLLAYYRTSEIALVTPLRDGMNLVAKEYCAASVDNTGVLILSEFAGAADQLGRDALLVNPYDVDATADAIYQAYTMPADERRRRMHNLQAEIRRNDVHRWVKRFFAVLNERIRL